MCRHAGLRCRLLPIDSLPDRIAGLQNGTYDALFAVSWLAGGGSQLAEGAAAQGA